MKENLTDLRANIDSIDHQILGLLEQRMKIVKKVGKRKSKFSDNLNFIRSGREATMLRELTAKAEKIFPPAAIATMWRMIISTSLFEEQFLHIYCYTSLLNQSCYWLAREYYGSFIQATCDTDIESIIKNVSNDKHAIGILPSNFKEHAWWNRPRNETNSVYIFAKIPFITTPNDHEKAFAIANVLPEETGDDIALLSLYGESDKHNIISLLKPLKKEFSILTHDKNCILLEIKGYIGLDDPILQTLNDANSDIQVRLLGNYARPIIIQ